MYKQQQPYALNTLQDWLIYEDKRQIQPYNKFSYQRTLDDFAICVLLYKALLRILPISLYCTVLTKEEGVQFGIQIDGEYLHNAFIVGDASTYFYLSNFVNGTCIKIPENMLNRISPYLKDSTLSIIKYNSLTSKAQESLMSSPLHALWIQCNETNDLQFAYKYF